MTKLRHLKAKAFRGARFELTLDFTKAHRSIAIFGENAAGKSTITDALEWFIYDRVEHLWREDCKQEALRHVLAEDHDASTVEVRFDGKDREGRKSLSAELKTTSSYSNDTVREFASELKDDGIILRHADIVKFLDETKGKKREAIAEIIGYEEITQFRSVIQQARNSLSRDGKYTGANQQSQNLQSDMVLAVGQVVPNRATFLEVAKDILRPFGLKATVTDEASYEQALEELCGLGNSAEKIKAAERLVQFVRACNDLETEIDQFASDSEAFEEKYNVLAKARESVNELRLSDFLTKGKAVIDDQAVVDDECPFCLSPYDLTKLQAEVRQRLSEMAEIQGKLEEAKTVKEALLERVKDAGIKARTLSENYKDLEGFSTLTAAASDMTQRLRHFYKALGDAFNAIEVFEPPKGFDAALSGLRNNCKAAAAKAQKAAKKLDLTELEKKVAEALTKLQSLIGQVKAFEKFQRIIDLYEAQILTLSTIFDRFVAVQNATLQAALDKISEDVGAFYSRLHPKESVDKVRLAMIGEEGVEFEYSFHGEPTQPPRKYLSESHLNSLGVVLFLANARIFNENAEFLVLDDIVTSFDTHHRRRLLRLLRDQLSDWQIIILTHENIWFDLIKKEMSQKDWLFLEVKSDDDNGILLDESPATLKTIIEKKKGKEDVTSDFRNLLEAVLKDICYALEVKFAFRFNDRNEKRMSDELIGQLRSTLNTKSPVMAESGVFADLAGSALIANLISHDNPDKIVGKDIDVLLEDIEKLAGVFNCSDCGRCVRADTMVPGAKAISCKCGKHQIPWKS